MQIIINEFSIVLKIQQYKIHFENKILLIYRKTKKNNDKKHITENKKKISFNKNGLIKYIINYKSLLAIKQETRHNMSILAFCSPFR